MTKTLARGPQTQEPSSDGAALGATCVDIGQGDDKSWVVLADPEGTEFCILRALTPEELAG